VSDRTVEVRAVGRVVLKIQGGRVVMIRCLSDRAAQRVAAHVARMMLRACRTVGDERRGAGESIGKEEER
jgi:hypothetical protein